MYYALWIYLHSKDTFFVFWVNLVSSLMEELSSLELLFYTVHPLNQRCFFSLVVFTIIVKSNEDNFFHLYRRNVLIQSFFIYYLI